MCTRWYCCKECHVHPISGRKGQAREHGISLFVNKVFEPLVFFDVGERRVLFGLFF